MSMMLTVFDLTHPAFLFLETKDSAKMATVSVIAISFLFASGTLRKISDGNCLFLLMEVQSFAIFTFSGSNFLFSS